MMELPAHTGLAIQQMLTPDGTSGISQRELVIDVKSPKDLHPDDSFLVNLQGAIRRVEEIKCYDEFDNLIIIRLTNNTELIMEEDEQVFVL